MAKRKVRNITVCVTPQIYRQTRHLAAEYDSTVSTIVAWLLQRLPAALERTHFPKGGPKPSAKPAPLPCSLAPSLPASPTPSPTPSPTLTLTPTPSLDLTPETCNLTLGGEAAQKAGRETVWRGSDSES